MSEPIRLQRFLSQAGVAARRKSEELIVAGRVTVNGKIVKELGTKVDPERDHVTVDGEAVMPEEHFYLLFNKPKGCITAVRDDRGRPTVMDYLPNLPVSVAPVGRLDFYTEGVLLLTNDGELAAKLLAPKSHVNKTYHVKIFGLITANQILALREGVVLEDGTRTQPAEIEELPGESKHSWLGITLHEGKSRQIHRMCEALGMTVQKIQRVAFANLTFHGLRVGDARELAQGEVNDLRALVGLDRKVVSRGKWKARREDTDIARRAADKRRAERAALAPAQVALPGFDDPAIYDDTPERFERELRDPAQPAPQRAGQSPRREPTGRVSSRPAPQVAPSVAPPRRSTVASGPMAAFGDPRPDKPVRGPQKLPAPIPPRSGGAGRVKSRPSPPSKPARPDERRARPGERPGDRDRPSRPGSRPSRPSSARPGSALPGGERSSRPGAERSSRPGSARPSSRPGAERPSRPSNARPSSARPSSARPSSRPPARGGDKRPSRPGSRPTTRSGGKPRAR